LQTDVIVFSAGIRPQDELARSSELQIGERGGIVIDDSCQTSDQNIYAIGECALWEGRIFGLVAPGYQMAKVAAAHCITSVTVTNSAEKSSDSALRFKGSDMSTKLKLLGVDVASIGDPHGKTSGSQSYSFNDESNGVYKKVVISNDGKKLLGAVMRRIMAAGCSCILMTWSCHNRQSNCCFRLKVKTAQAVAH
jgi:nitrite reductase (NADH) large subunit